MKLIRLILISFFCAFVLPGMVYAHTITVNTSNVDPLIQILGLNWIEGDTQTYELDAGTYYLNSAPGGRFASFTLESDGSITYEPQDSITVSGQIGNHTISVVGYPITIDAVGLSQDIAFGYWGAIESFLGWTESGSTRVYNLVASSKYRLCTYHINDFAEFGVDSSGKVFYDTIYDGILNGAGTTTVDPIGYPVTIDAIDLSQDIAFGYWGAIESFLGWTESGSTRVYNLVASSEAPYQYRLHTYHINDFAEFGVDSSGKVFYDTIYDGILNGAGTTTVDPIGYPVTIDAIDLSQDIAFGYWVAIESFLGWTESGSTRVYNLVASSEAPYQYRLHTYHINDFAEFGVDSSGKVFYDTIYDGILNGAGTTTVDPIGYPVTIDAIDLSQDIAFGYWVAIESFLGWTESGSTRVYNLVASSEAPYQYRLHTYHINDFAEFGVDSSGKVFYDTIYDGILNGAGTTTVDPIGHPVTVDATDNSQQIGIHFWNHPGFLGWTDSGSTRVYYLVASSEATYQYRLYTYNTYQFALFGVDSSGNVYYDTIYDGVLGGAGTQSVNPIGHPVTIDATDVSLQIGIHFWNHPGFLGWTDSGSTRVYNLVSSIESGREYLLYTYQTHHFAQFGVDSEGKVYYDSLIYDGVLAGAGTSTVSPVGHPIVVDATQVTGNNLYIGYLHGSDPLGPTAPGATNPYKLVATVAASNYQYSLYADGSQVGQFGLDSEGYLLYGEDPNPVELIEFPFSDSIGIVYRNPDSDSDGDGTPDSVDGCPYDPNKIDPGYCGCGASELDSDGDGTPDCIDTCPDVNSSDQSDTDADGLGNICDNCPVEANPGQEDGDSDGVGSACDNCPLDENPDQADTDGDGVGNVCDVCIGDENIDSDSDGQCDASDNCSTVPNLEQEDFDGDGNGDECDNCPGVGNSDQANEDGDIYGDACDNCPYVINDGQEDNDNDQLGDVCDEDDDNDDILDVVDNCPFVANSDQADFDGDGIGDACDGDDDGDGISDGVDQCPATEVGAIVDVNGCSGEQLVELACPCDGDWKNHGKYVSCVAQTAEGYIAAGLISESEKGDIVSERAKSGCGKKK